jgi:DNA-binding transcriptional ArsR family regulator
MKTPKTRFNKKIYEMRATVLKAMAHPSRLMMIEALSERGEASVTDLVELVGSDQSTVSKHLSVMKQAGLVDDRKEGQKVFYRLRFRCVTDFFACTERVMQQNLKAQQRILSEQP